MHVVKNVSESVVATLFDIKGKTKDTWKSRRDLMESGLKKDLHLIPQENSFSMPMACYHFTKEEKKTVLNFIQQIKFPDGLASNMSQCIKNGEFQLSRMKSHDLYVFIQRVLPVAVRGLLTKEVRQVLFELSEFFKKLCSKNSYIDVLETESRNIAVLLCKMEFPPSFFDIMIHLMVHLPEEARIAGPAQYRWMFPFERKMGTLKGYVNNKARPEGCIAERYIDNECLTFCSMYLSDVETTFNKIERNNEIQDISGHISVFSGKGRLFGTLKCDVLKDSELAKIHTFVLNNCDEIEDLIIEHKQILEAENAENVDQRHSNLFASWFRQRVLSTPQSYEKDLHGLALGPDNRIKRYTGCMVNGYRFHTKGLEKNRKTQNSGVVVKGVHGNNEINYFGVLHDIIQIEYLGQGKRVVLFKCDWFNSEQGKGLRIDKECEIHSINLSSRWYEDQQYVLASQVNQVFYVPDLKLGGSWHIVQSCCPRNSYNVPQNEHAGQAQEVYQEEEPNFTIVIDLPLSDPSLARGSIPLVELNSSIIDGNQTIASSRKNYSDDNSFINDDIDENGEFGESESDEEL